MHDIIFVGMEEWDDVWRRSQNLAVRMARRMPQRKILFVGLSVDLSHAVRKGRLGYIKRHWRPVAAQALEEPSNIFVFKPVKLLPNSLRIGRLINEMLIRKQIKKAARSIGIHNPLLWIKPHYAAHMMGKMSERAVLYDVGDDWTAFHQNETLRRRAIAEDEHLTRQANAVVVVSEKLLQMKRTLRDKVHLVPNGADIEHYAPVAAHSLTPHPVTDKWKHPVLGHTGTLHPDRTDVELILSLARQFRFGTIALVGPLCVGSFFEEKFAGEPNIVMTGPMPYQELPRIMSVFDLCFVPQKVNDFTESQNPLKLFEYLASGLPIVSTPISGFRDYSELVHLAQTPQEFVAAAEAALNEDRNLAEKRRAAVTDHSWDARVDAIFEVFKGITAHKKN